MSRIKLQSEYKDLDKYKYDNGDIVYYKKDTKIFHNPYGPAYTDKNGYKGYWIEGKVHRLDGPARIWPDDNVSYFINGRQLSEEEFESHPERLKFLGKEYLICLK